MTVHVHELAGCAPTPLAHYLKALGILRVVALQSDAGARGFWDSERFCLASMQSRDELEQFFLRRYAPTPFLSPWNKGSGFFKQNDPGLTPLENSVAPRFEPYRSGIRASRGPLSALAAADREVRRLKHETKQKKGMTREQQARANALKSDPNFKRELAAAEREFKRLKADLYAPFAATWRGRHRDWLDAAMVLADDGTPTWPSLLGTGGNDGRLDFTNNAMQRLAELFDLASSDGAPRPYSEELLRAALWGAPTQQMINAAVGQFLPGTAGGANGTTGPDALAAVNPWDFVLMLEGALLFRGRTTRTLDRHAVGRAAVPFALNAHAAGIGTRGTEKSERGEQWMPIWNRPATLPDVEALLGEGRAQLGRRLAQRPIDFARAIGKLGIARGVTAFERYAYLERNGQSKIAVPIGRLHAGERPRARLVDDLAPWLDRMQRLVRDGDVPSRLAVAEAHLADATFAALLHDGTARWQEVLIAAARFEQVQVSGTAFEIGPIPALSMGWLDATRDDTAEWRLACALASAHSPRTAAAGGERGTAARSADRDPVRVHILPLDGSKRRYATTKEKRLVNDPRVVFSGRDALTDLIALVDRRLVEAGQQGRRELPLVAWPGAGAQPDDLSRLLGGSVDLDRTVWLARALAALRWQEARLPHPSRRSRLEGVEESWQAIRLCGLPFQVRRRRIPIDPALTRRLASGDAPAAIEIALRRLRTAGFRPPLLVGTADRSTARRWVAALAFPIEFPVAEAMGARFEPQSTTEHA